MTTKTRSELLREANRWAGLPEDYSSGSDDCHIAMHALSKTLATWNPVKHMPNDDNDEELQSRVAAIVAEYKELVHKIFECCVCPVHGRMSGLDFDWYHDSNMVAKGEIYPVFMIAPTIGEIVGGADDGSEIFDFIDINLGELIKLFDTTDPHFDFMYVPVTRDVIPGTDASPAHIALYTSKLGVRIFFEPLPNARAAWVFDTTINGWRLLDDDEDEDEDED